MSEYNVHVQIDVDVAHGTAEQVQRAVVATLQYEGVEPPAELSVLLSDNKRIRQLNREFRGIDKPTDVLSFPTGEAMPGADDYLGDIAIAVAVAQEQAASAGHDLDAELSLLTIHGVLHLLGHDHAQAEEKARMWMAQDDLLAQLGLQRRPLDE